MLFKLLTLAVIGFLIYWFVIRKFLNKKGDDKSIEMMVECSKCGVFISNNEAIVSNGKYFCSRECLDSK